MTKVKDMGTMLNLVKGMLPIKDKMKFLYSYGKMMIDGKIWEGITITVDDNEPETNLLINTFMLGEKECLAILFKKAEQQTQKSK